MRVVFSILTAICSLMSLGCAANLQRPHESDTLRLKRIELVDAQGTARMTMEVTSENECRLTMFDSSSRPRCSLRSDALGNALVEVGSGDQKKVILFSGQEGEALVGLQQPGGKSPLIGLKAFKDGSCALQEFDRNATQRLCAGLTPSGEPGILLADARGNPRSVTKLKATGDPTLGFLSENGKHTISLDSIEGNCAQIDFCDSNGQCRGSFGLKENGQVSLITTDLQGKSRIALGVDKNGPRLVMFGADGTRAMELGQQAETRGGEFFLRDAAGKRRFSIALGDGGMPSLIFRDGEEHPRIIMDAGTRGSPSISLHAEDDKKLWSTP